MAGQPTQRMTFSLWTVCVIAAIGFAFDIYELLMLPLVVAPALQELAGYTRGTPEFARWFGLLFYVPAACGGVFGLLGGYLTDRFGRRRVLTWSILLYAFSAFFAGFSTNLYMLLLLRTTTFIGVCVEFVAAVAWLAELFDDPVRREKVLGYTQAFSSIGGLLVAVVNGLIVRHALDLPAISMPAFLEPVFGSIDAAHQHAAWRYTLMSGLVPAIPLIVIRPFLPESPKWAAKKAAGTLRRPSVAALFSPEFRRTTIITTVMFACSYGVAFGAIQQMPQIVPGINLVRQQVQAAVERAPAEQKKTAPGRVIQEKVANYTKAQETGGLFGRFALALLVAHVASRRALLRMFLVPGLIFLPLVFLGFARGAEHVFVSFDMSWLPGFHHVSVSLLGLGIFVAGFFTVAQFSFWGNYLPKAYPVHLRGTGESFAANIGGRMFGTPFAYVTQVLAATMLGDAPTPAEAAVATAKVAAAVAAALYLANLILSYFLPEQSADQVE
ncbi:MAG: MFS transporter [Planctomycetota bacterium]|nr:MAG: MFS transporter [Planctomycetota bacterium]